MLWLCEEGRKGSEQFGFGKISVIILPPFPEVVVNKQPFSREMGGGTDQVNLKQVYESLGDGGEDL